MARRVWFLVVFGLLIMAAAGVRIAWIVAFDPAQNDPFEGMLLMAVFAGGLLMVALGAISFTKARGGWTPPV
jgi:hypothetical protein